MNVPNQSQKQRAEVQAIMEAAHNNLDLEGVLTELVADRDRSRALLTTMLGCVQANDTESLAALAANVRAYLGTDTNKSKPSDGECGPLAHCHFPESEVSMVHQTGASHPLSTGLTVRLIFEPVIPENDSDSVTVRPVAAILNYCDEAGDDDETVIGLTFTGKTLIDYDGAFDLPLEVAAMLAAHGYDVRNVFEEKRLPLIEQLTEQVRVAGANFKAAENLVKGDRVIIARVADAEADKSMLGSIAEVVGFISDDCGATPEDLMVRVRIEGGSRYGELETFRCEELEVFSRVKKLNDAPLPTGDTASKTR